MLQSQQFPTGKTSQILGPMTSEAMVELANHNKKKKNFLIAPTKKPAEQMALGQVNMGDELCKTLIGDMPVGSRQLNQSNVETRKTYSPNRRSQQRQDTHTNRNMELHS